jgi:FG-GAP-like repeat
MRLRIRQGAVAVVAGLLLAAPAGAQAVTPGPDPAFAAGPDGPAAVPGGGSGIVADQPCLGDFNGDGNLDVGVPFVGATTPTPDGVVVMLGDGTGHLGTPTTPVPAATAGHQTRCATGDFNGDGRDDIAAVERGAPGIQIALGQANGTFTTSTIDTSTAIPTGTLTDIAVGDIDHNGTADLAVAVTSPNEVVPFKGDGAGGFAGVGSPGGVALAAAPVFVTLHDVNNDNLADALVGLTGASSFQRASGQPDGSFLSPAVGQAVAAHNIGFGDFNGDGSVDALTDGGGGAFGDIRLGNNSGSFTSSGGQFPGSVNSQLRFAGINAADYNNDGLPDAAAGGEQMTGVPAQVWTFKNEGSSTPPILDQTSEGPFQVSATAASTQIATGDMNNDGRLDIVAGTIVGGRVGVLLNTTAVPGAVTGPASAVADDSATINGTIYPSACRPRTGSTSSPRRAPWTTALRSAPWAAAGRSP